MGNFDIPNLRYNPFSQVFTPYGYGYSGNAKEVHTISATSPYYIYLNEIPQNDTPSTLFINEQGGSDWTEVSASTSPAASQFRVAYGSDGTTTATNAGQGIVEFNSADAGKIVEVKYYGLGAILQNQLFQQIIDADYGNPPFGFGDFIRTEIFTANDTWTVPTGITTAQFFIKAGGGGGGGGGGGWNVLTSATGGGGGGGSEGGEYNLSDIAVTGTVSIVVGAGGSGGAGGIKGTPGTNGTDGSAGGSSSITISGKTYTALGGNFGAKGIAATGAGTLGAGGAGGAAIAQGGDGGSGPGGAPAGTDGSSVSYGAGGAGGNGEAASGSPTDDPCGGGGGGILGGDGGSNSAGSYVPNGTDGSQGCGGGGGKGSAGPGAGNQEPGDGGNGADGIVVIKYSIV